MPKRPVGLWRGLVWLMLVTACWIAPGAAKAAPFNVYIQVFTAPGTAVSGEVTDPLYAGWSEVDNFSTQVANAGTLATPKPPDLKSLVLVKSPDVATPTFLKLCTAGNSNLLLKLTVVRSEGDRVELWDLRFDKALVQSQGYNYDDGNGSIKETLTVGFSKTEWSYIQVDGQGQALASYFAGYDASTNTITSGTRPPVYPGAVDTDGDGIPDVVERYYGLNPNVKDSNKDSDGDGLSNFLEFIAGTDPTKATSFFRVTSTARDSSGQVTLTWSSVANKTYTITAASTPAGPYTPVKNVASAGDGQTSVTLANSGSPLRFYRVQVTGP